MEESKWKDLYEQTLKQDEEGTLTREDFLPVWLMLKEDLNTGKVRVASKNNNGEWKVNTWVKKFILLGFKFGKVCELWDGGIDKDTLGEKEIGLKDEVRKVSSTVSVRDGAYLGKGVTLMPPCYVNIGAYVDEGSMVDSLALVGSCAQVGKKVHIGAGAILGGVLEPVGAYPVIIEDNVFVGAGSQITEGTIVKQGAIIGAGVTVTGSTPVYDNVNGTIITPNENGQIIIPENAVVIPGTREVQTKIDGVKLAKAVPIIIKYGGKVELEDLLRP